MSQQAPALTAAPAAWNKPAWPQTKTKEQLLAEWEQAKSALDVAKDLEMELRKQVVSAFPFPAEAKEGTQRVPLANGYSLKVVLKQNYRLDDAAIDAALDKIEATGPEGKFIVERLVNFKASLSVKEYKLLKPEHKAIVDTVLTISDGSPTLEIEEPKVKK